MTKAPKKTKAPKADAAKEEAPAVEAPGMVEAVVAKEFTSTLFGNLSAGRTIEISAERYAVWKDQGLVN